MNMGTLYIVSVVFLIPAMVSSKADIEFRNNLIKSGDIHLRPNESTTVSMSFVLTALNKLDSVNQELDTTFLLYMSWVDPRLAWNPEVVGTESIVFYVNEIWTPPLVVSNAIEDSMFLLRDDTFPMRAFYDGTVTWVPRLSPTTTCKIDTSNFPVDIQTCDINITSWVHSAEELVLLQTTTPHYPHDVNLDSFTEDKSWELVSKSVQVLNQTGGYGIEYCTINNRFNFRRHERFYWVLLVVPGICLAFLQPFVFIIPLNDYNTRISYSTTTLLSFIFYTGLLTQILPPIFSVDRDHVFGEVFGRVMIFGTAITLIVILQVLPSSIINVKKDINTMLEAKAKEKTKAEENGVEKEENGKCLSKEGKETKEEEGKCLSKEGKETKEERGFSWRECCKYSIPVALQVINAVVFLVFLMVYVMGIISFLSSLAKVEVFVS